MMAGGQNGSFGDNSSLYGYEEGIPCDPGPNDTTLCNLTLPLDDRNGTEVGPRVSYELWQIIFLAILAGTTSIMTILGNLVVIISFIVERSVRQPTNYFIASLAVSDLLIGKCSMMPSMMRVSMIIAQNSNIFPEAVLQIKMTRHIILLFLNSNISTFANVITTTGDWEISKLSYLPLEEKHC